MKKLTYVILIALVGYVLQGCNSKTKTTNQNVANAPAPRDTASAAVQAPADPNAPANPLGTGNTPRVVEQQPLKVNNADAKSAISIAEANLDEVSMAIIAVQITRDAKIKAIADTLVASYHKINDELIAIAKTKNLVVPTSVSADMQKKMQSLEKKSGKAFDKAYINEMTSGNKKAFGLYQDAEGSIADADLKAFALKTKPIIQKQIDAIAAAGI
jgi:putative membrane protein